MDQIIDKKLVKTMSYSITTLFLAIHVGFFILFTLCNVTPMARFNIFSILFYLVFCPLTIHHELWRTFAVPVYLEVVVHMTLAVCCVGWDCGFQVTLVGMSILVFYAEYIGRATQIRYVPAVPLSIIGMIGYFFALAIASQGEPPYPLSPQITFWLQVACSFVTFVVTITFLQIFVLLAFQSETVLSARLAHDKLTSLPNRYHLASFLKDALEREGLEGYWLAMADIDDFKHINDTYGHNCGDYVLKTLADLIRESNVADELCRWGGEEFVLVGHLNPDGSVPLEQLDRLRKSIEEHRFWYEENRLSLTITIGVVPYTTGASTNEWINAADKKLYEGKCSGKNRVMAP